MTLEVPCCEIASCQHVSLDNRIVRVVTSQGVELFVFCERHEAAYQRMEQFYAAVLACDRQVQS